MWTAWAIGMLAVLPCLSQEKTGSDVMVLVDGEKLMGQLESADSTEVVFKSKLVGEVKVPWAQIQTLESSGKFAIAQKGEVFGRRTDPSEIPQGTLSMADQKMTVTQQVGAPVVISVANTQNVVPEEDFMRAFSRPRLRQFWSGSAGAGFGLVDSTQTSKTFTSTLGLVRTVPSEAWISPRYRTTLTFNSTFGTTSSGPLTIRTNIIHAGLEQDEYISPKLFFFGDGTFDHNYAQGLSLQYTLGGGFGYVAYKDKKHELDLKAQLAYTNQIFSLGDSTHLIGAVFGESYNRAFRHSVTLHEELSVTPSFNVTNDYSANGLLNLGIPITKKIGFTSGLQDSYLNNPPPGFRKNSFQFVTNLTYKID